jgi:hypothetical protein
MASHISKHAARVSLFRLKSNAQDVVTGFVHGSGKARGCPVGLAIDTTGALLDCGRSGQYGAARDRQGTTHGDGRVAVTAASSLPLPRRRPGKRTVQNRPTAATDRTTHGATMHKRLA